FSNGIFHAQIIIGRNYSRYHAIIIHSLFQRAEIYVASFDVPCTTLFKYSNATRRLRNSQMNHGTETTDTV
ncbi:unnamed protein product, partial [Larinioides sclopetarius]